MTGNLLTWETLANLSWQHLLLAVAVLAGARVLSFALRAALRRAAESASPHLRLTILRAMPVTRFVIVGAALLLVIAIFVEPTFANAVTVLAAGSLALAYALKDYGSSLVAGVAVVLENAYQPGDWVEMAGTYGEVKAIELRATRLVTADDTEVIIPNSRLWSSGIANATSGKRSLLCVAHFYLDPDHDPVAARAALEQVAESSALRKAGTDVAVIVTELPWGTSYKLKAYATESREQFEFITDLTIRGKVALRAIGVRFARATYAATPAG